VLPLTAAAATLLALGLGSYRLGAESLWVDEAASAGFALGGPGAWIADHNMALYYMLLGGCVRLFGHGEHTLRALSVLCFAAGVPVLYRIVQLGFGAGAARVAVLMHVCNAFMLELAQEARGYMLAVLLVLVAQLALMRVLDGAGRAWIVAYALTQGLAVYAHLFALWTLAANAIACAPRYLAPSRERRALIAAGVSAGTISIPLLWQMVGTGAAQVSWIRPVSGASLLALPVVWTGGSKLLATVSAVLFVWFARGMWAADARARRHTRLIVAWLGVPCAAALLVSLCVAPMLLPKYLIMTVPALEIGAAVALTRAPRKLAWPLAVGLLLLAALRIERVYRVVHKEPWRESVRSLFARIQPGEPLLLELPCPEPFHYYVEQLGLSTRPPPRWPARAWGFPVPDERALARDALLAQLAGERPARVWIVSNRSHERPELGPLTGHYALELEQHFAASANETDQLFADTSASRITLRSYTLVR